MIAGTWSAGTGRLIVALHKFTTHSPKHRQLVGVLNTFRHDPEVKGVAKRQDGLKEDRILGIGRSFPDKTTVDFQAVRRQVFERPQR